MFFVIAPGGARRPEKVEAQEGRYGLGDRVCSGCCEPIEREEIVYEVQSDVRPTMHFHLKCHVVWQVECVRRMKDEPTDA